MAEAPHPTRDPAERPMPRSGWLGFTGLSLVCVAGAVGYVAWAAQRRAPERASFGVTTTPEGAASGSANSGLTLQALLAEPHLIARSVRDGEYGHVVVTRLHAPEAERIVLPAICERVHFGPERGLCILDNRSQLTPPAYGILLDAEGRETHRFNLPGFPSRTRISRDQRYAASTVFVTGDDYEADFSTRTNLIDLLSGRVVADLEQFKVLKGDQVWRKPDFNFWGVTFGSDGDTFYATLRSGDETHLLHGAISRRELRVLRPNVECPSLSPDGRRIAFKKRMGPGQWRLHVLDVESLEDRPIAEARSIDDQVEWLDNEHVLYGIALDQGRPPEAMNIWVSPLAADASSRPRIFLSGAVSPSVVRP